MRFIDSRFQIGAARVQSRFAAFKVQSRCAAFKVGASRVIRYSLFVICYRGRCAALSVICYLLSGALR
jgi:hypothetical protein